MNHRALSWRLLTPLLSAGALGAAWAQTQTQTQSAPVAVWRCGQLFTNQPQPGQACEPLSSLASTVVEGTRVNASPTSATPSAARDRTAGAASPPVVPPASSGPAASATPASPAAPAASAQQARMLLQAELREQEERWQQLQRQWNQGQPAGSPQLPVGSAAYQQWAVSLREQLQRAEADLAALRRELARLP